MEQPVEDEATRLKREQAQAEKQEQLRLKRDQKQQEMQAKRDARRQQMAEKQTQRKASSNGLKLSAVKTVVAPTASAPTPALAPASTPAVTPSVPSASGSTTKPTFSRSISQLPRDSIDENDGWGDDVDLGLGDLQEQAGTVVEDELFKDLEVTYKKPAYVGATTIAAQGGSGSSIGVSGSNTSISSSSNSSSITLSNSVGTVSTAKALHSPTTTFHSKTLTTVATSPPSSSLTTTKKTTTTTTATSTTSFSLKATTTSAGSPTSGGSSPTTTPKHVASSLLKTAGPNSVNGVNGVNGVSTGYTKDQDVISSTPAADLATPVTVVPESLKAVSPLLSSSSLALQVDESALEEDGWGDDWDQSRSRSLST